MSAWLLCVVAVLLSVERVAYVLISRNPARFKRWSMRPSLASLGGPVEMLMWLFVAFKVLQIAVFVGWHLVAGDGPSGPSPVILRWLPLA
jgi:hypothetical protein